MTPTKLLVGQILIVFAIVIVGVWFATEWCAAELGFQPQAGSPWFVLLGIPVYCAWQLLACWLGCAYVPSVFNKAGAIAASSGVAGCAVAIIGSLWWAWQSRLVTTYGSSRRATGREIEAEGLFRSAGVFLGRLGGKYLRRDGPEHVMAFAPTRSGKGAGVVIPTLLSWTGSAVIHDIKGEIWQLTAGGGRSSRTACCSIRPIRARPATTRCWRCWRCVGERTRFAMSKTSPTSWSIRRRAGVAVTKLRSMPNDNRDSDNAPAFRVFVGQSRIGDAWEARSAGDSPRNICALGSTIQASASRSAPRSFHRRTATSRSSCGIGGGR